MYCRLVWSLSFALRALPGAQRGDGALRAELRRAPRGRRDEEDGADEEHGEGAVEASDQLAAIRNSLQIVSTYENYEPKDSLKVRITKARSPVGCIFVREQAMAAEVEGSRFGVE